jgi:Fe-coproporphyrin III synthase
VNATRPLLARDAPLQRLPLVTLYLSERCNSRCVTCDYWRYGKSDLDLHSVSQLLPALQRLHTQMVLLSGGEPLLHPQWAQIAQLLRAAGIRLWLLTSGLSLVKHAARVAELIDTVTVSLDGTEPATYERIRGLDAFDKVCAGIQAVAARAVPVTVRVTLQQANFRQLSRFVSLARELGAVQVSFLAVDVANPHAFARREQDLPLASALSAGEVAEFAQQVERLISEHAADIASGFIADSPRRLRHLVQYFRAVCGVGSHPPVRCNAPEFSAVVDARGAVHPCFFIPGPDGARASPALDATVNGETFRHLRGSIRAGERAECRTCVCSAWHTGATLSPADRLPPGAYRA